MNYETNRENFNKLKKDYENYVALYKNFNNGSIKGITPFAEFYWNLTYKTKYEDPARNMALGD
ncbi:MAG: hypothetical protein CMP10_10920 [Zetaproteobacteria bacterium]|nr:hypothetical protein [Pseudobdellovibrionaceae bacterium]|tara:strand:- start:817 stop:1005 length:189 start_codon:yes stop_codon:yes gene_type:complete